MGFPEQLAVISFAKDCVTHLVIHILRRSQILSADLFNQLSTHRRRVFFEVAIKSN